MESRQSKKPLGVFALVMINIIAVDSLRSLPFSAKYGFSLVFFYLLAGLCFFLPTALVSAELATGWPNKGGVYVWVREAFGEFWGFLVIWLQWVYNIAWYPTILSFLVGTFAFLVDPALVENKAFMLTAVMIFFWGATLLNLFGMRLSSLVSTFSALLGTLLPMALIVLLGTMWLSQGRVSQIHFSAHDLLPHLHHTNSLAFLTALLFGLVGMELSAVHADEVERPGHAYPRAILWSTLIIIFSLVGASLAIAIVVPPLQLHVITGLVQAFQLFFHAYHLDWFGPVMTVLIIIGGLGGVAAWIIGPTKGLLVATQDGSAPPFLAKMNKHQVPVVILLLQALIFTALCSVFFLLPTVASSYWVLTAVTAQLAMLVYVILFAAALYLRYKKPYVVRAFNIPFGRFGLWAVCLLGMFSCFVAIGFGFVPPAQLHVGAVKNYELVLIGGVLLLCLPPWLIYRFRRPSWGR